MHPLRSLTSHVSGQWRSTGGLDIDTFSEAFRVECGYKHYRS